MHSHLLFSYFRFTSAKLYLQINKRKFGIILTNFISKTVKVQTSFADQNSNCILSKMLQIIYLIKFGRDKVHTISSKIIIDNFFYKEKKCMDIKIKKKVN